MVIIDIEFICIVYIMVIPNLWPSVYYGGAYLMAKSILWWSLTYGQVYIMVVPNLWPSVYYGGP
jgi:hypothetical protein